MNPGTPECSVDDLLFVQLKVLLSSASIESVRLLRVGVRSEDFVYPLRVERHVDEDAGLVLAGAASAVDAHAHDDLDVAVLTNQGAAVISLRGRNSYKKVQSPVRIRDASWSSDAFAVVKRRERGTSRCRAAPEGLSPTWRTFG